MSGQTHYLSQRVLTLHALDLEKLLDGAALPPAGAFKGTDLVGIAIE